MMTVQTAHLAEITQITFDGEDGAFYRQQRFGLTCQAGEGFAFALNPAQRGRCRFPRGGLADV
jgi:hypothetical protein